ncbi:hypothetical protein OEZ85_003328 [Tetradesmus obliquus]|uniref:Pherophorin domain-containing protein n=1 Tax=Tetradesmus obliquus TaxID=3088 RepID=A0ABY8UAY3_TETOB|nr:hypothetical protein OEZ85_003328 [Tetradesmus obliquus]
MTRCFDGVKQTDAGCPLLLNADRTFDNQAYLLAGIACDADLARIVVWSNSRYPYLMNSYSLDLIRNGVMTYSTSFSNSMRIYDLFPLVNDWTPQVLGSTQCQLRFRQTPLPLGSPFATQTLQLGEVALYGNTGSQIPRSSLQFAMQPRDYVQNKPAGNCNDGDLDPRLEKPCWAAPGLDTGLTIDFPCSSGLSRVSVHSEGALGFDMEVVLDGQAAFTYSFTVFLPNYDIRFGNARVSFNSCNVAGVNAPP